MSQSFGVGACTYPRRLLENQIAPLLQWVYEARQEEREDVSDLSRIMKGRVAENKIQDSTAKDSGLPSEDAAPEPCQACEQQRASSRFLKWLNRGDDTLGSASYTQIATNDDEIIIPFTRCFLRSEVRTANLILQAEYGYGQEVPATRQNIYDDPVAQEFMLDGLDNAGPARPKRALADFPLP